MKTKMSDTSVNCYFDHVKGFKENGEDQRIYETIKRIQPCTGRMIQRETGIEIGDVARSLNNLWYKLKPAPIQISHKAHCPISGVRVKFYHIANGQISLNL